MAGLVGAGRTNVARAIFGVEPPTAGRIQVDGQEVAITSPQQAIELGLAYVPEDRQLHGLIPAMHITSNISLPMLSNMPAVAGCTTRWSARPAYRCSPADGSACQ